ncbi:hypothetical protein BS47DRAFT_1359405 [Hydnum rufescens UP504]|uniref:Uncharacterized protein n=1 Tax=Hydnum rufescens UP504 TaxID=1448309 RepID=A0A9P6B503_9AGAM|nr:hypothetical protein BS47DRAFT_1359405 [Hydnum rufescens UP504]
MVQFQGSESPGRLIMESPGGNKAISEKVEREDPLIHAYIYCPNIVDTPRKGTRRQDREMILLSFQFPPSGNKAIELANYSNGKSVVVPVLLRAGLARGIAGTGVASREMRWDRERGGRKDQYRLSGDQNRARSDKKGQRIKKRRFPPAKLGWLLLLLREGTIIRIKAIMRARTVDGLKAPQATPAQCNISLKGRKRMNCFHSWEEPGPPLPLLDRSRMGMRLLDINIAGNDGNRMAVQRSIQDESKE